MAVTISVEEVAVAIRAAGDVDSVPPPIVTVITVLLGAASAIVIEHASQAPDAVHNVAVIRLVGWLYDADPSEARSGQALRMSGAQSLLAGWREHRAGPVGATPAGTGPAPAPTPAPTPGGNVPEPPAQGDYVLTSVNGEFRWIEFPQP